MYCVLIRWFCITLTPFIIGNFVVKMGRQVRVGFEGGLFTSLNINFGLFLHFNTVTN